MSAVLYLHVSCAFVWLVCVLAETAWARAASRPAFTARWLSRAHLAAELPAFLGVLLTGGLMAGHFPMTPPQALKIATGLIAIGVNVHCVLLAPERSALVATSHSDAADPREHRLGAVALLGLALGAHLFVG